MAQPEIMTMTLSNGIKVEFTLGEARPTNGRQCGSCSLCCKLVPVKAPEQGLDKPGFTKCRYSRYHPKGCCSVYGKPAQPTGCQQWSCRWLLDPDLVLPRPDRSHYVVDILPDRVIVQQDGQDIPLNVLQIWVDPAYPLAYRDSRLLAFIDAQAKTTGMAGLVRLNRHHAVLLMPACLSASKRMTEKPVEISLAPGIGLYN